MNEPGYNVNHQKYTGTVDRQYSTFDIEESVPDLGAITSTAFISRNWQYKEARRLIEVHVQQIADLFRSPVSHFCLATFFVKRVAFASESFVFQYASEKFLWPLHQTTYLRVATASGAIFATLIACPASFSILSERGFAAHKLDLDALRISLIIVLLSFFYASKASSGLMLAIGMSQDVLLIGCRLILTKNNSDGWLWAW